MEPVSRAEHDAKLYATEARMDARVVEMRAVFDAYVARSEARDLVAETRYATIERDQKSILDRMNVRDFESAQAITEIRTAMSSLKTTIVVTGIASVLTIIFGVASINAALLSNMLASFESGKAAATTHSELKQQGEETATMVRQIQRQLQQPAPGTK